MHQEIRDFISTVKASYPDRFKSGNVLEAGSLNINGSVREYFKDSFYVGVDVGPGDGVDIVTPIHKLEGVHKDGKIIDQFDVVISTEMLEHDQFWKESLKAMVDRTAPGGMMIITCAGPGREEHGTTRTDTYSSPHTTNYYRNISKEDFLSVVDVNLFLEYQLSYIREDKDLVFYGVKKGHGQADLLTKVFMLSPAEQNKIMSSVRANRPKPGNLPITVCIPTKNRYNGLHLTLLSIALQTYPPAELILVDDSDSPVDLREDINYMYIFKLMTDRNIDWKVRFGAKKGQHYSHQTVQEIAQNDLIFRIDDDEIAEPNVLINLYMLMDDGVGAVAPAVLMPNPNLLPEGLENKITPDMASPNIQWFLFYTVKECEHLYSCFLYRRGIATYELGLSTVCHREETIFTHSIYRAGYKLLADGKSVVWHFRAPTGGIRSFGDSRLWEGDEAIFQGYLKQWGYSVEDRKVIVLDSGLGDHYALKSVVREIRDAHPGLTIAACYPEVFAETGIPTISIAEAKQIYGNIDRFHIYKWMHDHNWKGTLAEAYKQMYI